MSSTVGVRDARSVALAAVGVIILAVVGAPAPAIGLAAGLTAGLALSGSV